MKEKKQDKTFLQQLWFCVKLIGIIFLTYKAIAIYSQIYEASIVYSNYECDGTNIKDECSHAYIKLAGVLIKGCKSEKEYFCQSVIEIPIEIKQVYNEDYEENLLDDKYKCEDNCWEYFFDDKLFDVDTCLIICEEKYEN